MSTNSPKGSVKGLSQLEPLLQLMLDLVYNPPRAGQAAHVVLHQVYALIEVENTKLDGVKVITPRVFNDARGFFMETFNARDAQEAGLPTVFVQDNHSRSSKGVLRGLHFQRPQWQGKLIRVVGGEIFDVAVDIRRDSPTYGQWVGATLSADNNKQMYIPEGFAHGFVVLSATADVVYKCTTLYEPQQDNCLMWNDADVGIVWPVAEPVVSDKDSKGKRLRDL